MVLRQQPMGFGDRVMQNCNQSLSSATYQSIFLSQQIWILGPWLSVMSCQPPSFSSCATKLIFRGSCVSIFHQKRWVATDKLIDFTQLDGEAIVRPAFISRNTESFKEFSCMENWSNLYLFNLFFFRSWNDIRPLRTLRTSANVAPKTRTA